MTRKNIIPVGFLLVFGTVGVVMLLISLAAQPYVAIEPELSQINSPVSLHIDSSASNGQAIMFNKIVSPPTSTSKNRIRWAGKDSFLMGANVAWNNWAYAYNTGDFGGGPNGGGVSNPTNKALFRSKFAELKTAGISSLRWWVFTAGADNINRDSSGEATSLNPNVLTDMDAALEIAKEYDMYITFVLFSSGMAHWDSPHIPYNWMTNTASTERLNNVLAPMYSRYESNQNLMAWELFNEPDNGYSYSNHLDNDGDGNNITSAKKFFNTLILGIRRSSPSKLITVGAQRFGTSEVHNPSFFAGMDLDFYQFHAYTHYGDGKPGVAGYADAWGSFWKDSADSIRTRYGLKDIPIILGEHDFVDVGGSRTNESSDKNQARLQVLFNNGYAGAWPWSVLWERTHDQLKIDYTATRNFKLANPAVGP